MRVVAFVLARSGSKRIKQKNIYTFFNKPMLAYPIEIALQSALFENVYISTDSLEFALIAQSYGASFLKLRPKSLANDTATTLEVLAYHTQELNLKDDDIVCCLYGTSILLQVNHLKQAFEMLMQDNSKNYVFACTPFSTSPFRSFNLELKMPFKKYLNTRSQDLPKLYYDAGLFYMGRAYAFKKQYPIFDKQSGVLVLSPLEVQDIDTLEDLELAKLKYERLLKACK
ncbi:pseudaminic acid cytidylyltransferase [Helicobacter cetorum]|uniref:pseudaminic acid cytidylyltransferase n=1 Tax=Helicobacter cetorum TaxID=138563 RepID=UPI000CF18913|nr:pseudaminic acid cytidylyltransferase [Helicobacter cetorum]